MTRISEIHGIPANEYADRGQNIGSAAGAYFPYLTATKGEMRLLLARQRAQIFAGVYPEVPQFRQAVIMMDNALNAGVQGYRHVGALHDDYLQQVARLINAAKSQTAPASRAGIGLLPPGSPARYVAGIGVIPIEERFSQCIELAKKKAKNGIEFANLYKQCKNQFDVEKILNDGVENSGHHMLYKSIPGGYTIPQRVDNKRLYHKTGVEGMAIVGKIDPSLMYDWVENGVLLKNVQNGLAPYSSVVSSFFLSPDPEAEIAKYTKAKKDKTSGVSGIGFVDPATAAIVVKVVSIISGALLAAKKLLDELRKREVLAMVEAQGFGTQAFSAEKEDWPIEPDNLPVPASAPGLDTNTLLLLGGAAALFLLYDDKK